MELKDLSGYLRVDREKRRLIDDVLFPKEHMMRKELSSFEMDVCFDDAYESREYIKDLTKYCPKCHERFPESENFCHDCLCSLKRIDEAISIRDITTNPIFEYKGKNDYSGFEDILTQENMDLIDEFEFSIVDFQNIIDSIKAGALKNMDDLIKSNEVNLNRLSIDEKVLLFAKSFVSVEYKSYGQELGCFKFNKITVDERITPALQITTLIHELSHFILKEITTQILCRILDCSKTPFIEAISVFILSYSPFTQLIDEYCAHTCEGRFAIYGYQDYSSFLQIERSLEGEMEKDEIEITKSIGNTFALSIKEILESFIDDDLRADIRQQFQKDNRERPNYEMLVYENCKNLTGNGFLKAVWLVVSEGFIAASFETDRLKGYQEELQK